MRGRERAYCDLFHDTPAGDPKRISEKPRVDFADAYSRPEALKPTFNWYRAMASDAQHNAEPLRVSAPLLYARGDLDKRPIEPYVEGLKAACGTHVASRIIASIGELIPIEAPEALSIC